MNQIFEGIADSVSVSAKYRFHKNHCSLSDSAYIDNYVPLNIPPLGTEEVYSIRPVERQINTPNRRMLRSDRATQVVKLLKTTQGRHNDIPFRGTGWCGGSV